MYCTASSMAFTAVSCFQFKKRYNVLVLKATWFSHVGKIPGNQWFFCFLSKSNWQISPNHLGLLGTNPENWEHFYFPNMFQINFLQWLLTTSHHYDNLFLHCWWLWWAIISASSQPSNCLNLVSRYKSKWDWDQQNLELPGIILHNYIN